MICLNRAVAAPLSALAAVLIAVSPGSAFDPGGAARAADAASAATATYDGTSADASNYSGDYSGDYSGGVFFDELRFGGSVFLKGHVPEDEEGGFINGQILFDPLWDGFGSPWLDAFLRPRPHLGATASFGDGTDQVFGGATWTFPLGRHLFVEASFGGTIHDGTLEGDPDTSQSLGCRVLFRESAGLGVNLGPHWRVIAAVDHSSHASLCDGDNAGLSHVGASLGYRF